MNIRIAMKVGGNMSCWTMPSGGLVAYGGESYKLSTRKKALAKMTRTMKRWRRANMERIANPTFIPDVAPLFVDRIPNE